MNYIRSILTDSRLATVIEQVEKGEAVDSRRVLTLQALDLARVGELYANEVLEREDIADGQFARWGDAGHGPALWGLPEAP